MVYLSDTAVDKLVDYLKGEALPVDALAFSTDYLCMSKDLMLIL